MDKQSVVIYFNDDSRRQLVFGNFENSINRIDDNYMQALNSWGKRPSGVCVIENVKGDKYYIYPSNINYIEINKK